MEEYTYEEINGFVDSLCDPDYTKTRVLELLQGTTNQENGKQVAYSLLGNVAVVCGSTMHSDPPNAYVPAPSVAFMMARQFASDHSKSLTHKDAIGAGSDLCEFSPRQLQKLSDSIYLVVTGKDRPPYIVVERQVGGFNG